MHRVSAIYNMKNLLMKIFHKNKKEEVPNKEEVPEFIEKKIQSA